MRTKRIGPDWTYPAVAAAHSATSYRSGESIDRSACRLSIRARGWAMSSRSCSEATRRATPRLRRLHAANPR